MNFQVKPASSIAIMHAERAIRRHFVFAKRKASHFSDRLCLDLDFVGCFVG